VTPATCVGRVRVARTGVNATLGGPLTALAAHVDAVRPVFRELLLEHEVDFKLEPLDDEGAARSRDAQLRRECGFADGVSYRVVDELVTCGTLPLPQPWGGAMPVPVRRLGRRAWDAALDDDRRHSIVVIDVRNAYESAIGAMVGALRPPMRATSEFGPWLVHTALPALLEKRAKCKTTPSAAGDDDDEPRTRPIDVLLYCTGGVRCEGAAPLVLRAAAALGAPGLVGSVGILDGGLVRYLQAVEADGSGAEDASTRGRFHGRLFVFDPRVSVAGPRPVLPGRENACRACGAPGVADYASASSSGETTTTTTPHPETTAEVPATVMPASVARRRHRCARCRVLILVCDACRHRRWAAGRRGDPAAAPDPLLCAECEEAPGR